MAINSSSEARSLVGTPSVNVADSANEVAYRLRVDGDVFDRLQLTAGAVLLGDGTAAPSAPAPASAPQTISALSGMTVNGVALNNGASDSIQLGALGSANLRFSILALVPTAATFVGTGPSLVANTALNLVSVGLRFHQWADVMGAIADVQDIPVVTSDTLPAAFTEALPGVFVYTVNFADLDTAHINITSNVITIKDAGGWTVSYAVDVATP